MYKILIADDETDTRNLLVKHIRQKEPDVTVVGSVTNGEEALKAALELRPDIVITDIYMPVMNGLEFLREAQKQGLTMKAAVISGYDEFEYAKEAISLGVTEYLLKPFSPGELSEVIGKMKQELDSQRQFLDNMKQLREQVDNKNLLLKERILKEIIDGKYEEEPPGTILDAGQDFYSACLIKLPLSFRDQDWDFGRQENVEELLDLISEGYFHKDVMVNGLSFDRQGAILVISGRSQAKEQFLYKVKKGMIHLQKSLEKYYSMKIFCVIGGIYENWRDLSRSYQEAFELWRKTLTSNRPIICCGEEGQESKEENQTEAAEQIKSMKEQIRLAVRMGQEKKADEMISHLIKSYASLSSKKANYASVSVQELVYDVVNDMESLGILHNDSEIKDTISNSSLLDIQQILRSFIKNCCKMVTTNRERHQADQIVEDARYLIENHLDYENLTLEWLSAQMNFSANYVRQVFKQKTGESFMEYLIRKRMEKAGSLLTKTDMMIQEVARVCGYSNQRYFASSFKKYYGCTPTKFKEMVEVGQR